jgi:glycosyltransferase involved in cell wall biosynthesis
VTAAAAAPALGPDVWVVIAAYNEGRRLGETLRTVCRCGASVVVVDDGSADDTSAVARSQDAWVLRHVINCGQGAALQTGIDFALARGAAVVVTFDADGQHAADDLERLVEPVRSGRVDVALGSRFLGSAIAMPRSRWLILKLGVLFTRVFSRLPVTDTHNGLRALSRAAAQRIRITQDRMSHASELLDQIALHGLRFCEVAVTIHYSACTLAKGQSSWNALRIVGQLLLGRLIR